MCSESASVFLNRIKLREDLKEALTLDRQGILCPGREARVLLLVQKSHLHQLLKLGRKNASGKAGQDLLNVPKAPGYVQAL
jgi:hypothetical protein